MILKQVKISELTALTESGEYALWKHIPVSPVRACSQSLNPNARPDDVSLILALDENSNDLVGFIGALPSKTRVNKDKRVVWVSNWWVAESARGRGVAKILLQNLIDVWGNILAFQDLTEPTLNIINKQGQFQAYKKDGVLIDFQPGFVSRIKKYGYSSKMGNVLSKVFLYSGIPLIADKLISLFLFFPRYLWLRENIYHPPLEIVKPDQKDFIFIRSKGAGDFHIPESEELDMPSWLVAPSAKNLFLSEKYPYSSFAVSFNTFWLRWEKNKEIQALIMLSLRDGVLKTNFVYCEPGFINDLPRELFAYCLNNKSVNTMVTAQHALACYYSDNRLPVFRKRRFVRYLAASKEIMSQFETSPHFQDGDGDYRFT